MTGKGRLPERVESDRLLMRVPTDDDVPALNEAIVSSHPELTLWMPWARQPQTLEETAEFCRTARARWEKAEGMDVLLVCRDTGDVVGAGGYPRLDWSVPKFEIGYWCRSDRTGTGLITEATFALAECAFARLGAARVELFIDDLNRRSWAVAERLGFRLEGVLRAEARNKQGELRNTRLYAATAMEEISQPL